MRTPSTRLTIFSIVGLVLLVALAVSASWGADEGKDEHARDFRCFFVEATKQAARSGSTEIDGRLLASRLDQKLTDLASEGYEILSVVPITGGISNKKHRSEPAQAAFGVTQGVLVTAQR